MLVDHGLLVVNGLRFLLLLTLFVNLFKDLIVIENRCLFLEVSEYLKHLDTFKEWDFLGVSTVGHRFVLVHLVKKMFEVLVDDVFHIDPLDFEVTNPLVRLVPFYGLWVKIRLVRHHLSYSTELATLVQAEEQVDWVSSIALWMFIDLIELIVAFFGTGPYLVDQRLILNVRLEYYYFVDVFLVKTLNHKESCSFFED
jgi:hypothetical protein